MALFQIWECNDNQRRDKLTTRIDAYGPVVPPKSMINGLGGGSQSELDYDEFGWVFEPHGCNLLEIVHVVPI